MATTSKSTRLLSTILSGRTNTEEEGYQKIFSSQTVRKLAVIQFINGLFLVMLHLSSHPYYNEGEDRVFEGGFLTGKKVTIVVMVMFYWVTGITGIIFARPIRSRCSLCYLTIVILISSMLSVTLIVNSIMGFHFLRGCPTNAYNNGTTNFTTHNDRNESTEQADFLLDHNCTHLLSGEMIVNKFRESTEIKLLVAQVGLSSFYLILKAYFFFYLSKKFKRVYSEGNPSQNNSQSVGQREHKINSNIFDSVYSGMLCCILNIWSISCKSNRDESHDKDVPMLIGFPLGRQSDHSEVEQSE